MTRTDIDSASSKVPAECCFVDEEKQLRKIRLLQDSSAGGLNQWQPSVAHETGTKSSEYRESSAKFLSRQYKRR